jgi:hypothetical protein
MIAPLPGPAMPCPASGPARNAAGRYPRRSIRIMTHFIGCLTTNLGLLALIHIGCWIARQLHPGLAARATRIFFGLMAIALIFDATLTYLVFGDAGGNWRQYGPRETFPARAAAYALSAVFALLFTSYVRRRAARHHGTPSGALVIETSPYSKSTLPM